MQVLGIADFRAQLEAQIADGSAAKVAGRPADERSPAVLQPRATMESDAGAAHVMMPVTGHVSPPHHAGLATHPLLGRALHAAGVIHVAFGATAPGGSAPSLLP